MNEVQKIQKWYRTQCNGDWEHRYGIEIESLDNPGWKVVIDLTETELEKLEFKKSGYELVATAKLPETIGCFVRAGDKFVGVGGPKN